MSAPPPLPGVEHRHVDAGGLCMHIAEAGEGEGGRDPILLVHGWPQHHYEWRGVIPLLTAAGRRVIAPDLRGFGWTGAPPGPVSAEVFAADLAALLDALPPATLREAMLVIVATRLLPAVASGPTGWLATTRTSGRGTVRIRTRNGAGPCRWSCRQRLARR